MSGDDWMNQISDVPARKPRPPPGTAVGNATEQVSITGNKIKKTEFPVQYSITNFDEVDSIPRQKSSLFPEGIARGVKISIVGPPGSGKTRYLIQESIYFSSNGDDVLYMYNESIRPMFDAYVKNMCEQMHKSVDDLKNITFIDMVDFDQKTADYERISLFIKKLWIQQIRYWMEHAKNPSLIVIDSFSKIARRFIPQMYQTMETLSDQLSELFAETGKMPTVIICHQKSQSSRERNDESVSGGFGLTHISDATYIFKLQDIGVWETKRYGLAEGSKLHSIQVIKDRYATIDTDERVVKIDKNGWLKLGVVISSLSDSVKEAKEVEHLFTE